MQRLKATRGAAFGLEKALRRPSQAVILAGGRGTRLRPITDTHPKPMVTIRGKPFLEYLVEMLRGQGFQRILLLLGYLPEVIQDHFGDGHRWGVDIEYSITGADDLTSHRMKFAAKLLEPCFLLLYCDHYWPMRMGDMWERFATANVPAMVTVYTNSDGYGRDSVRVGDDGYVQVFDRSRQTPGLEGVEIGYALLRKSVLEVLPEQDALFEEAAYPQLARQRQLLAYVTDHRYYSVGSLARLPQTERFLARRPAVIIEKDGVLHRRPAKASDPPAQNHFEWLRGAKAALSLLTKAGYRVIVISDSTRARHGTTAEAVHARIHERIKEEAVAAGGRVDAIYDSRHEWKEGSELGGELGALYRAQRDFDLDLTRTPFIGHDEADKEAAEAAGCPVFNVTDSATLLDLAQTLDDRARPRAT